MNQLFLYPLAWIIIIMGWVRVTFEAKSLNTGKVERRSDSSSSSFSEEVLSDESYNEILNRSTRLGYRLTTAGNPQEPKITKFNQSKEDHGSKTTLTPNHSKSENLPSDGNSNLDHKSLKPQQELSLNPVETLQSSDPDFSGNTGLVSNVKQVERRRRIGGIKVERVPAVKERKSVKHKESLKLPPSSRKGTRKPLESIATDPPNGGDDNNKISKERKKSKSSTYSKKKVSLDVPQVDLECKPKKTGTKSKKTDKKSKDTDAKSKKTDTKPKKTKEEKKNLKEPDGKSLSDSKKLQGRKVDSSRKPSRKQSDSAKSKRNHDKYSWKGSMKKLESKQSLNESSKKRAPKKSSRVTFASSQSDEQAEYQDLADERKEYKDLSDSLVEFPFKPKKISKGHSKFESFKNTKGNLGENGQSILDIVKSVLDEHFDSTPTGYDDNCKANRKESKISKDTLKYYQQRGSTSQNGGRSKTDTDEELKVKNDFEVTIKSLLRRALMETNDVGKKESTEEESSKEESTVEESSEKESRKEESSGEESSKEESSEEESSEKESSEAFDTSNSREAEQSFKGTRKSLKDSEGEPGNYYKSIKGKKGKARKESGRIPKGHGKLNGPVESASSSNDNGDLSDWQLYEKLVGEHLIGRRDKSKQLEAQNGSSNRKRTSQKATTPNSAQTCDNVEEIRDSKFHKSSNGKTSTKKKPSKSFEGSIDEKSERHGAHKARTEEVKKKKEKEKEKPSSYKDKIKGELKGNTKGEQGSIKGKRDDESLNKKGIKERGESSLNSENDPVKHHHHHKGSLKKKRTSTKDEEGLLKKKDGRKNDQSSSRKKGEKGSVRG